MKIAVLGAGMVGRTIATDLAVKYSVTCFDISETNLQALPSGITTAIADLSDYNNYTDLLEGFDMVASAVPGFMGYKTLSAIISSGKNVVDISFFPEDALSLHALALEKGVTAIVDCGVAPGMSNYVLGFHNQEMKIQSFECMVGGLPIKRTLPFQYKAPFSPVDVIEEYTRPARYIENGKLVTRPALSDSELIDFDYAGTLESFNTDGLRSIIYTMSHIPNMKEKTLRYPGHIDIIRALKMAGFFEEKPISINGVSVSPLSVTSAVLFNQWKLQPGEKEFTIMKIMLNGEKNGLPHKIEYFLYDEYDLITNISSMSRTTGYTCTASAALIIEGLFTKKGVYPPELVGSEMGCFESVLAYLSARGVNYKKTIF